MLGSPQAPRAFGEPIHAVPTQSAFLTIDKLLFAGAVPFGSRALDVDNANADYDFAMLRTNFETLMKDDTDTALRLVPAERYFKIVPPWSTASMIVVNLKGKTDILLLEKQWHVDAVRKSVEDLKELPRYHYTYKPDRVRLYQLALLHNGFVHNDYKERIKFIPRRVLHTIVKVGRMLTNSLKRKQYDA